MRAILLSIQPKWVEKICNGSKTIEVRKTIPKINEPFKCYIYCTKGMKFKDFCLSLNFKDCYERQGKVIGEFVCDKVDKYEYLFPFDSEDFQHAVPQGDLEKTCLENYELDEYLKDKCGYGLHISQLKIYDKPKELEEMKVKKGCMAKSLIKPPQSWCYVEDLGD